MPKLDSFLSQLRSTLRAAPPTPSPFLARNSTRFPSAPPLLRSAPTPQRTYASSSYSHHHQDEARSRGKGFIYVLGIMPVFTFALGTWQVKRLQWKLDLIQQLEDKLNKDTVGLPARIDPAAIPEFAYRKVRLEGEFDHDHEILLGPKTRDGELGFHVITPLVRGDGKDTVLVNRGFVKRLKKDRSERADTETKGKVEVVGMLRDQERPNSFTPANSPAKGEWVWADIKEMAEYTGSEPVLVDEIYRGNAGEIAMRLQHGVPVGRAATIELRNQHLTYAFTWYTLSLFTAVLFVRLLRKGQPVRLSPSQSRSSGL